MKYCLVRVENMEYRRKTKINKSSYDICIDIILLKPKSPC